MFANELTERLAAFVRGVGIEVRPGGLPDDTFLPGLDIHCGAIVVDDARLSYPGDLLHEAGHVAVADPAARSTERLSPTDAEEMAALAWSWAALTALELDPAVVFHPHGYKGANGGASLIDAFSGPQGPGVPMLHYFGMSLMRAHAKADGPPPFPHMLRWVR